jgi:hypothetical protein
MSYRNRIVIATAALTAALFLAAPSPSHAAGHPWGLPVPGAWERAWTWLTGLLPGSAPQPEAQPSKTKVAAAPTGGSGTPLTPPPPSGTQSDEGGAMNPDGVK